MKRAGIMGLAGVLLASALVWFFVDGGAPPQPSASAGDSHESAEDAPPRASESLSADARPLDVREPLENPPAEALLPGNDRLDLSVVDERDEPIVGASVTLQTTEAEGEPLRLGSTGADGSLEVDRESFRGGDASFLHLRVEHGGYATRWLLVPHEQRAFRTVLERAAQLEVRVRAGGVPAVGATVSVLRWLEMFAEPTVVSSAACAAGGLAVFGGMPGGLVLVEGAFAGFGSERTELALAPGERHELELDLRRCVRLVVEARDSRGEPIAGVRVMVRALPEPLAFPTWRAATDAGGRATFGELNFGLSEVEVRTECEGRPPVFSRCVLDWSRENSLLVSLDPPARLEVEAVTPSGRRLPVPIGVRNADLGQQPFEADGVATGEFAAFVVPPDTPLVVFGIHDQATIAVLPNVVVRPGETRRCKLELPEELDVTVAIRRPDGRPGAGVVELDYLGQASRYEIWDKGRYGPMPLRYAVTVGSAGTATTWLAAGRYQAKVYRPQGSLGTEREVNVVPGARLEFTQDDGITVAGTLVDQLGRPLAGQFLQLSGCRGLPITSSAPDGRFVFRGLAPCQSRVQLLHPLVGAVPLTKISVREGMEELELVCSFQVVRGHVSSLDDMGTPLRCTIHFARSETTFIGRPGDPRPEESCVSNDRGEFVAVIPTGNYLVFAKSPGLDSTEEAIAVQEAVPPVPIEIGLYRGVGVKVDRSRLPVEARLLLLEIPRARWSARFDLPQEDGLVELRRRVPRGDARYTFLAGDVTLRAGTVQIGRSAPIVLPIE